MRGVRITGSLLLSGVLLTTLLALIFPSQASAQGINASSISGEALDGPSDIIPDTLIATEVASPGSDPAHGYAASFSPGTEPTGDVPTTVIMPASTSSEAPLFIRTHTPTVETNLNITSTVSIKSQDGEEILSQRIRSDDLEGPVTVHQFMVEAGALSGRTGKLDVEVEVILRDTYGFHTFTSTYSVIAYPADSAVNISPVIYAPLPPLVAEDQVQVENAQASESHITDLGRYARHSLDSGVPITLLMSRSSFMGMQTIASSEEMIEGLEMTVWAQTRSLLDEAISAGVLDVIFTGETCLDPVLAVDSGLSGFIFEDIELLEVEKVIPVIDSLPQGLVSYLGAMDVKTVILTTSEEAAFGVGSVHDAADVRILIADETTALETHDLEAEALASLYEQHLIVDSLDPATHVLLTTLNDEPSHSEAFVDRLELYSKQNWIELAALDGPEAQDSEFTILTPRPSMVQADVSDQDDLRTRAVRYLQEARYLDHLLTEAAPDGLAALPVARDEMGLALDVGLRTVFASGEQVVLGHAREAHGLLARRLDEITVQLTPVELQGSKGNVPAAVVDPLEERIAFTITAQGQTGLEVDGPASEEGILGSTARGSNYFDIPIRLTDSEEVHALEVSVTVGEHLLYKDQVQVVSRRLDIKLAIGVAGVMFVVLMFVLRNRLRAAGTAKRVEDDE